MRRLEILTTADANGLNWLETGVNTIQKPLLLFGLNESMCFLEKPNDIIRPSKKFVYMYILKRIKLFVFVSISYGKFLPLLMTSAVCG